MIQNGMGRSYDLVALLFEVTEAQLRVLRYTKERSFTHFIEGPEWGYRLVDGSSQVQTLLRY